MSEISSLLALLILIWWYSSRYKKGVYYQGTGNSFWKTLGDKGLWGEYKTVRLLENVKGYHKTLINVYLPNGKGGTTEVDIIFLHETGIYVIESKNYSGWIFGKEQDNKWCQSFPNGRKEFFYNPVKQNHSHIAALKQFLYMVPSHIVHSLIIFSERCTLKRIELLSSDIVVINRNQLPSLWKNTANYVLSKEQIDGVYQALTQFTRVSEEVKQQHIEQVQSYRQWK